MDANKLTPATRFMAEMADYGVNIAWFTAISPYVQRQTLKMKKKGVPPAEIQAWVKDFVARLRRYPPYDK